MNKELSKTYNPQEVENRLYDFWISKEYFHAEIDQSKKPYTIVIPPPNITGQLHMGHALDETLQDIVIRLKRMQGYSALWLPGTDHASIATEVKIVEAMNKEGISKNDIGRDEFLKRAWKWKEDFGGQIVDQLKKLGSSCDWDRERFTLDERCNKAVKEVFVRLYDKGLIHRGEKIINWCPNCSTSISDAEVNFTEHNGHFWHIRYPLSDNSGYIEIATTRPETMLGDTAVAVNPHDDRYKHLIGKTLKLPLVDREIPIIADEYVEQDFGTGAVKITPAHDPNDFEVGERHNLPIISVMDEKAVINKSGGKYQGLDRYEARKSILKDLDQAGFLVKDEAITHNVGECYRCSTTIEPLISKQWFLKMDELAKPSIECVKKGEVKFIPERFSKIHFNWMENIKDWCISRQLWWGHRIPAWHCKDCDSITVSRDTVTTCDKCGSNNIKQDEDVLDTWFSSALWPFSTLGWPDKTPDLEYFYPTNTLITAYDIIFFWVSRMIFSAIEHTHQVPFNTVLIHGLVRDDQGRKMSKSLGNGIDPLEIINKFGADALRFTLATGNSPGNDMRFAEDKIESSRNFTNKIWNAARFIHMNIDKVKDQILNEDEYILNLDIEQQVNELTLEDKWIISSLNDTIKEVTDNLEKFEIGIAAQKLYDFTWDQFCDWYIELAKSRLQNGNKSSIQAIKVLIYVMTNILKLLHPFIPFITEEIFLSLPHKGESIMISEYPKFNQNYRFKNEENAIQSIMEAIKSIRNRRAEMNVPPSKKAKVYIETSLTSTFEKGVHFISKLASASEVEIGSSFNLKSAVTIVTNDAKIYIPMDELIDKEEETKRLQVELQKTQNELSQLEARLNNQQFISKAPEQVVKGVKDSVSKLKDKANLLQATLSSL